MKNVFLFLLVGMIIGSGVNAGAEMRCLTAEGNDFSGGNGGVSILAGPEETLAVIGEAASGPVAPMSFAPYVVFIDCTPHAQQGIEEGTLPVPADSSVVIRLRDDTGIEERSIRLEINGSTVIPSVVRQVVTGDLTDYWVVYRPPEGGFEFGEKVEVSLGAADINGREMESPVVYSFRVESKEEHAWSAQAASFPVLGYMDPAAGKVQIVPDYSDSLSCWFEGAKIIFDGDEPVRPRFGPVGGIPELDLADGSEGLPVVIEPPTVFQKPVTVCLPCPAAAGIDKMEIYSYNPGLGWEDAEGVPGLLVAGSRIDRPAGESGSDQPAAIEIQINQSGIFQAGMPR